MQLKWEIVREWKEVGDGGMLFKYFESVTNIYLKDFVHRLNFLDFIL